MWIFPWIKLSWHSCSMWDKLGWLNWFGQFLYEGLSSFNLKRFYYSYAWSCSLCERRTFFAGDLSLENSVDSYLCFWLVLLNSVSYFFFLRWSPLLSCTDFDSIWSNIDGVLSINPSANVFVFGDFNIHHKDWLTYSSELIDLVNSVTISLSHVNFSDHVIVSVSIDFPINWKRDACFIA